MKRHLRFRNLVLLYLLLLVASHVVRSVDPHVPTLRADQITVEVHDVAIAEDGRAERLDRTVAMAFSDFPGPSPDAPTVVLVHGSPVASIAMVDLAEALSAHVRVILPDLPGMGNSEPDVASYSVRAHAVALEELLTTLDVQRAHYVGYSMGGGVILETVRIDPERVASLVMLSAIGVQEFELLGDYHLNHAVHALQLLFLEALFEAFPHFGVLDAIPVNPAYARNFFDTDQRPLRGILESYAGPMQILHGTTDVLVPEQAALEHRRLVPQSELVRFDGGHITPIHEPASVAGAIVRFVEEVEAGEAATRAEASPERRVEAAVPFDRGTLPTSSGFALGVMIVLLALATLASEDLACIGGGILVANGSIGFFGAVLGCSIGILGGDIGLFIIGRLLGRRVVRVAPFRWLVSEATLERAAAWLDRRGAGVIFASRFTPGLRVPTYLAAGVLPTRFFWFVGYFLLATALWTPAAVGLGAVVGRPILDFAIESQEYAGWILLGEVLLILLLWKLVVPLCSHRGRRFLVRRWIRLTRFEYWPVWVFYPPLVLYAITRMIRHRSMTVFAAANPGIEHGGFIGESKREILTGLTGAGLRGRGGVVAPWVFIDEDDDLERRVEVVRTFCAELEAEEAGSAERVVLKPDRGERGSGVEIVSGEDEVRAYLSQHPLPVIAQRFTPGLEFGVLYTRHPAEERGSIFAITDKRFPSITGDGERTVEELVLADRTLLPMAPHYLGRAGGRAHDVLAAGERLKLIELGTHCLGSIFLDGAQHITDELTAEIDRISRTFDGFHFGRYDIRVPSVEAFEAGRDLTVIELNGVSSEATNIYDPKHSVFFAYRTLFRQWRLVYTIGAESARRGAPVPPTIPMVRSLFTSDPRPRIRLTAGVGEASPRELS